MIGLVDFDLCTSTSQKLLIPNIEIMKLAHYYQVEEHQFCRLLTLEETDLSNYDKIYFFSELNPNPSIPEVFLRSNIVTYGGTAFTNGIYKPFENEVIDYTLPKPAIYKEFLKQKYDAGIKYRTIEHVLDDTYYRNYAGENKLPLPAILPRKRIFLYDRDFFYPDWENTIELISSRKPSSIIRLHPIICNKLSNYFKLREYTKFARSNLILLDIDIPLEEVNYMFKKYKNLFLADIVQSTNVMLPIGNTQSTNLQYVRDLVYKLNLLYSFWSQGILIKMKFLPPRLGYINPIINFEKMIEVWTNNQFEDRRDSTINSKIPKKKKDNILRDEKDLICKYYPQFEKLCVQSFNLLNKQGRWRF